MHSATPRARVVAVWLFACAAAVLALVVVGGVTRLTRSGLSIVEWKPVVGVLPPLTEGDWQAELEKYRASPEGRLVNAGMSVESFQQIFYVEWFHRLLGRGVGLLVLVPLGWLLAARRLSPRRVKQVLLAVSLGGVQGVVGWLMVASGLEDRPAVSHYRLALHLVMALGIFALLLWSALEESGFARERPPQSARFARGLAVATLASTAVTVLWGAFMAGLHAGHVASTFPTMNGEWVPTGLFAGGRSIRWNLAENGLAVHFVHRTLAYSTLALAAATSIHVLRHRGSRAARNVGIGLLLTAVLQVSLGAATVLTNVSIVLATLHQLVGALLLGWCVALVFVLRAARDPGGGADGSVLPMAAHRDDAENQYEGNES